jgi:putative membrane protein
MYPMMGGGGMWLITFLLMFATLVAVAVVVAVLRSGPQGSAPSNAEELLRTRYARGEIDTEEFEQRMATLGAPRH